MHYGKDLREARTLIGTGGVFIYNPHAAYILHPGDSDHARYEVLRPKNPEIYVDATYLLYAVGLLADRYPGVAARIFNDHVIPVRFQQDHQR